jgi:hypothetical protein
MTSIFRDAARQEEFDRRGFTVIRLLDRAETESIRHALDEAQAGVSASCRHEQSFCTPDADYRRRAHGIVAAAIADRVLSLLEGYRVLACGVIDKSPGKPTLPVHRDPDLLADERLAGISVWCPLVDVDEASGALTMLPGSHKLPNIQAAGLPGFYSGYDEALAPLSVTVALAAGEAVLFNQRICHGSCPNRSGRQRPALRAAAIPSRSRMILHRPEAASEGARFELIEVETGPDGVLAYNPEDVSSADFAVPVLGYVANRNRPIRLRECKARVAESEGRRGSAMLRADLAFLRQRLRQRIRPRPAS